MVMPKTGTGQHWNDLVPWQRYLVTLSKTDGIKRW
jgi:hypothetical protein